MTSLGEHSFRKSLEKVLFWQSFCETEGNPSKPVRMTGGGSGTLSFERKYRFLKKVSNIGSFDLLNLFLY